MSTYVAIAYRFGWSNGHWYLVSAGDDEEKVCDAAEKETGERGGKYGVAVFRVTDEDNDRVFYSPSSRGEPHPEFNAHISASRQLGSIVVGAITDGNAFISDENGKCSLVPVPVPQWIRDRYERERGISEAIAESHELAEEKR